MNRCNTCNVNLYNGEDRCPLCKCDIPNSDKVSLNPAKYPLYYDILKNRSPLRNIPLFVSITAMLICIYINIFSHRDGRVFWSGIVVAALILANAEFWLVKTTTKRFGAKILLSYIFLSLLLFAIDFFAGMLFWSTNYVFPFLTLATTVYLTVLALRSKRLFSEYFGYIMAVIAMSLIPIPIFVVGFSTEVWGMFVSVITSIIISIGLFLFADETLKKEIAKRFHR